ncbi:MAG: HAD family phosphatase [Cryobacterium sp.]|nr:HAD family phosphatase [Cryobacterium sp.]
MNVFLFDFDDTVYDYDFRRRLPALSILTGVSQYALAKQWWAGGFERRAEAGEWPTSDEYLAKFAEVTGATISLENWRETRMLASTPIPGAIEAVLRAAELGRVGILTNNPSPFRECFGFLAPEISGAIGEDVLVSADLRVRKPDAEIYEIAAEHFDADPKDVFFTDDSTENVEGAVAVGMHGHKLRWVNGVADISGLNDSIEKFLKR